MKHAGIADSQSWSDSDLLEAGEIHRVMKTENTAQDEAWIDQRVISKVLLTSDQVL